MGYRILPNGKLDVQFMTYEGNGIHLDEFKKVYKIQNVYFPENSHNNRKKLKPRSERICRFCGKDYSKTTFKKKAHKISRLFGNNYGVSDYECDICNHHFSTFESSTSDFIGIDRTIFALGKDSVPVYKAPDGSIEAREETIFDQKAVKISARIPRLIKNIGDKGEIEMNFKSNSYIPLSVYKSLLKIALTIMPEEDIADYRLAIKFLLQGQNTLAFESQAKQIFRSQLGGEVTRPYTMLYKKIDPKSLLPSHIFQIYYQDTCLQFHLPFSLADQRLKEGEVIPMPMCPPMMVIDEPMPGNAPYSIIDLSSNEKTTSESRKLFLNFDKEEFLNSVPVKVDTGEISDQAFDPDEIVKIYFTRHDPKNLF